MEAEFVRWLQQRVTANPTLPLGLLDDASWICDGSGASLVVTTDMLCDGVHFEVDKTPWELIGRKALAVNLSDLAAMAAVPRWAFISLAWPRQHTLQNAQRVLAGCDTLAREFDVQIAGGDTNVWNGPLVVNVTLIGQATARGVLSRQTAHADDVVAVTGPLGGSLLGHHLLFPPRVRESLAMHAQFDLHAGMDISDGLALDLHRLAQASGVGAVIELPRVPVSDAARLRAAVSGKTPLEHALTDGEDFELLFTCAASVLDELIGSFQSQLDVRRVGYLTAEPGLWTIDESGQRHACEPRGYLHQ